MTYRKLQELVDFAVRTRNIVLEQRMNSLMMERHKAFCAGRKL